MTSNPCWLSARSLFGETARRDLRQNIRDRGAEVLAGLQAIQEELDGRITGVQGTGLLFSAELDGSSYKSYGAGSIEEYMRHHGLNVIHGGENSLRFTPNFDLSSEEVALIVEATKHAMLNGPVKASVEKAEAA